MSDPGYPPPPGEPWVPNPPSIAPHRPFDASNAGGAHDNLPSGTPPFGPPAYAPIEARSGLPYADYGQRVGAYLIDGLIVLAMWVVAAAVTGIAGAISEPLGSAVSFVALFGIFAGTAAMVIAGDGGALGQTPGKHLVGIKVVGARPGPIGYGQGSVRWLGRIVDNLICCLPVGLLWPLFDAERRAWHDMVADTRVVVSPPGERTLGYWWRHFRISSLPPPVAGSPAGPRSRGGLFAVGVVGAVGLLLVGAGVVIGLQVVGDDGTDADTLLADPSEFDASGSTAAPSSSPSPELAESPPGEASGAGNADPSCTGRSDGTLTFGGLTPQTGDLSFIGPPSEAAIRVAVDEINAAGGVLGRDVAYLPGDSGDSDPDVANPTVDGHLAANVDAIVAASGSGVSLTVIDKVVGACTLYISSTNTSSTFTDYPDDDLYFRTVPSDTLQGVAVAELMVEDGSATATIIARQDAYGESLLTSIEEAFVEFGGVASTVSYDPDATSFQAEVDTVVSERPDAVVLVGFAESAAIIDSLSAAGIGAETRIYLVDGNIGDYLGETVTHPGALAGARGTLPAAEVSDDLAARMSAVDPSLVDYSYGPETYDAVIVVALAAVAAGTDNPAEIARQVNAVTRDGEPCVTFADCVALLGDGQEIDYDGASGPLEFDRPGEPSVGSFTVMTYGADNLIDEAATEYRQVQG